MQAVRRRRSGNAIVRELNEALEEVNLAPPVRIRDHERPKNPPVVLSIVLPVARPVIDATKAFNRHDYDGLSLKQLNDLREAAYDLGTPEGDRLGRRLDMLKQDMLAQEAHSRRWHFRVDDERYAQPA